MPKTWDTGDQVDILSKNADQSSFAKEKLLQLADGPESMESFAATISLLSPASTRSDAVQKLKAMFISALDRDRPYKGPPFLFSKPQPQPGLPSIREYLASLEKSQSHLDGLQQTLLKIADEMESATITLQVARIHRFQEWDQTEIIQRLLRFIPPPGTWTPQSFTAFFSILLLEPDHPQAWELFNQALANSPSAKEFLESMNQAKESQEPYWTFTSNFEQLDYRPYWNIGKKTLQRLAEQGHKLPKSSDDQ